MDLTELREKLTALDQQIIKLVAERQGIVEDIGATKRANNRSTRDYDRERVVLESAEQAATDCGVSPRLAKDLMRLLIESSLSVQEQQSVVAHGKGMGKRALVIGGAGKMGGWFCRFLTSQGYSVDIGDPGAEAGVDWQQIDLSHDVIVVATPLSANTGGAGGLSPA